MSEQVQELRRAFLNDLETKGESTVHPADLNRVKTDDMWLERYLMHHDYHQRYALEMMWRVMAWRKDFKANEINESNIKMEYIIEGGFFPRGRDKDGKALLIFKCKKHVKRSKDMDELKRCVVYWFERLERQEKGQPITIFFDMDGCGVRNMDKEFTKYLMGMFRWYYPYFLNYIIIYEMAWILSADFKSWLPEKAVQKIKMLKKNDLGQFVPLEQALRCWGGEDDYMFSFVPEPTQDITNTPSSNKKMKTTAPKKFRVRPSAGVLAPGDTASITITLLPPQDLADLWKDEQRRTKELINRIDREKLLQLENSSIRLQSAESEANNYKEEVTRQRMRIEKLENERKELSDQLQDIRNEIVDAKENEHRLKEQERRLIKEQQAHNHLIEELSREVERLRSEARTPALPTTSPEALRLDELHEEMASLREVNTQLSEANEELQASLLHAEVEQGRKLTAGEFSLAAELDAMTHDENDFHMEPESFAKIQQALKEQQEVNSQLRAYIDGMLLNIVEKYPQLLEVNKRSV